MKRINKRVVMALLLLPVLFSCATYNGMMSDYYSRLQSSQYDKALHKLESSRFMKRNRNELLLMLEAGRLYFLMNNPVKSNYYFNRADALMESSRKSAKDIALGNLLNPMMQAYRGEDFEPFMVHFYKAINYMQLGQREEAVVEARRITLSSTRQQDKVNNKSDRYGKDAFAFNVQGILYEQNNDINNAFIAYRNAADLYLDNGNEYYGVPMPDQLKQDLLRTASLMGFTDELERYEKKFQVRLKEPEKTAGGELLLFLEQGEAPTKEEQRFFLTNTGGGSRFFYTGRDGYSSSIPFDNNYYGVSDAKLSRVRTFSVALPVYRVNDNVRSPVTVSVNGQVYQPSLAQDMNQLAIQISKERFLTELANALARQVTKKLLEKGAQKAAERIAERKEKKDKNDSPEEKERKKKEREEKAEAAGELAGLLVNLTNTITEKADTRNWQSLPAFISYLRVPLHEGENILVINVYGKSQTLKVTGGKGMQALVSKVD